MATTGAKIRFLFTSDTSGFDLGKVDRSISATKIKTEALNAAMKTLQLGMAATIASSLAIVMPFSIATGAVGELDRTLRLAASAAEDTAVYDQMMKTVSDMAIQYGVAKNEIAGAVFEMSKAGIALEEMNELLEPSVQMAMANMMDLSEAMSVSITLFNLFGDSGYEAAEMIQMLDKAASIALLDVDDLPAIIQQTGSAFAISSVELEKYLALMGALSQEGILMGARHGSIITQMLGREEEIENILGTTELIKEGVLDLDLLMGSLAGMEEGTQQYKDLLSVFGAGKGGKTFLDLMKTARGSYFDFVTQISNTSDELEKKTESMADSIPALKARITEAMTAPFANTEVIERMNAALNSLLTSIQSDEYERAVADIVVYASNFIRDSGPQMVKALVAVLEVMRAGYPMFMNFANIALRLFKIFEIVPPQLLFMAGGMRMMYKNMLPLFELTIAWAGSNEVLALRLRAVQMGMMGVVGGFMLAITAGDSWLRWAGVLISTLSAIATAYWAVNAARAAGHALSGPVGWALIGGAGVAAAAMTTLASEYSAPAMGGDNWAVPTGGSGFTNTQGEKQISVDTYIANQNNYSTDGGEYMQQTVDSRGGA